MKIAIVGLGIVGASLAMGLKNSSEYEVYGIDLSEETIKKALELGVVKEASTNASDILPKVDCTVLAIYPDALPKFIKQYSGLLQKGSLLIDLSGIKGKIISEICPQLPPDIRMVFAHPMAGREKSGIDYASSKVNQGANFLITPIDLNHEKDLEFVEKLAKDAGFGRVTRISPQMHDSLIAYTSQLPHAMAVALVNSDVNGSETARFIGDSYRDLTRIASINAKLWSELFLGNQEELLNALDRFEEQMNRIRNAVSNMDSASLESIFEESSKRHEEMQLEKKA